MAALAKAIGRRVVPDDEGLVRFADWCARHKDGMFEGGETISTDGIIVVVRKLRRRKVGEAAVSLI